jgi:hypothetical protein
MVVHRDEVAVAEVMHAVDADGVKENPNALWQHFKGNEHGVPWGALASLFQI